MDLEKKAIIRSKNAESHRKIYNLSKLDPEYLAKRASYSREYYLKHFSKKNKLTQIV